MPRSVRSRQSRQSRQSSSTPTTLSLYQVEATLVDYLRRSAGWVPQPQVMDHLLQCHPALAHQKSLLNQCLRPSRYKILGTAVPFLSPVRVQYQKRVPCLAYRTWPLWPTSPSLSYPPSSGSSLSSPFTPPLTPLRTGEDCSQALVPLLTCWPLWRALLDLLSRSSLPDLEERLQTLWPQWSPAEWQTVVTTLTRTATQISHDGALRAEWDRMEQTEQSHYPWWRTDDHLRAQHRAIESMLPELMRRGPVASTLEAPCLSDLSAAPTALVSLVPSSPYECQGLSPSVCNHLALARRSLYAYFQHQFASVEIQYWLLQCQGHADSARRRLLEERARLSAVIERFPQEYSRLRQHFDGRVPRLSNEQLFHLWQQARGHWALLLQL